MLDFIRNILPSWTKKPWAWVRQLIAIPLLTLFISSVVILRIYNFFMGPDTYFVYLVGDFSNNTNLQKLRPAFEDAQKVNLQIGHVNITVRSLDAKEKDAEKISAKLAKKNDTLLVIGHLSTTASANALPNYLNADPSIPVILAVETNPELLPADYHLNYYPVFRLSPTDDQQAEKAAEFAVEHGARAIWVVGDVVVNPIYSRYLAQEFVSQVHERSSQLHEKRQVYEKRQAYENKSSKVLLWTTNLEHPSADVVVKALRIDWVFFAGSPANCLILTRQVKEIWRDQPNKPNILLSNSCASSELLKQGSEDMKEAFLTHPMLASDFNKQGFAYRGTQASQLLQQLIRGADYDFRALSGKNGGMWYYLRLIFGSHSVVDARNALNAFMEQAVNSEQSFILEDNRYTFNRDGTVKETPFHVWQVQTVSNEIKFKDVEE